MNSLTKVLFKNINRQEKQQTFKEKMLSGLALLIVFGFLSVSMIVISISITHKLKQINQEYTFINILLLMNFLILFTKSIFESINVLYFSKDLKILLRMPIKAKDIVSSKLLNMIISEYEMETIMLAIPMVVYGIFTKVSILFYIYTLIILIILPIIPIMITSMIIAVVMRFTNIIKNKTRVMYLAIIIAAIILDFLLTGFGNNTQISHEGIVSALKAADGLAEAISNQFILIKPIMNTLKNYNNITGFINISTYITESIIAYFIGVGVISKIYFKGAIGTVVNSKKSKRKLNLELKDFQKKNKRKSYMSKEMNIMTRTPIFFLQCIIVPIIYPIIIFEVFVVAIMITRKIGVDIITEQFERIINTSKAQAIFLGVGQVFFMMNFASIVGVSKEGRGAILMKSFPISLEKQFNMKTRIGRNINLLSGLFIIISYFYAIRNWKPTLIVAATLYLLNANGEKAKLFIDLKKPQINWNNEYTMMKQNSNIMNVLFYTLAILVSLFLLSLIIPNPGVYLATIFAIALVCYFGINIYISTNEEKIFKKVY